MASDVKITLAGSDYQLLKLLLRWQSGKLTVGAMQGALLSLGWKDDTVTDVNGRLEALVRFQADRLYNQL